MKKINISRRIVKTILFLSKFFNDNYFIVVCKGYGEDDENYTGLYWNEDKDLDFSEEIYSDFQIWYSIK